MEEFPLFYRLSFFLFIFFVVVIDRPINEVTFLLRLNLLWFFFYFILVGRFIDGIQLATESIACKLKKKIETESGSLEQITSL